jgi:hypothetical protein
VVDKRGKEDSLRLSISEAVKTILFVGDTVPNSPFMLGESFKSLCDEHDLRVFNLEGSFSNSQKPLSLLKAGPHLLLNKKHFGPISKYFNVAILANNHSMDFGTEGLQATIELCNKNGIATVGAGMSLNEAFLPLDIGKCRIISVAENEFGAAKENKAGIATVDRPLEMYRIIKEGREAGKFVVVVAHGGSETITIPPPYLRERYKLWIEYGVDLVIGNHPHVVQGYERYNGKFIFYSLGNFVFFNGSFEKYPNANWSVAVSVDIVTNQINAIPILPDKDRNIDLSANKSYAEEFKRLCAMITSPNYQSMYEQIAVEKYSSWYSRLATNSVEDAVLLLHYLRCDAHRNMVQSALSQAIGEPESGEVKVDLTFTEKDNKKTKPVDEVKSDVQSGNKYLGEAELESNNIKIRNEEIKPFWQADEIAFMEDLLKVRYIDVLLEYGSGNSTIWFSQFANRVISVEGRAEWYQKVKKMIMVAKVKNVELFIVPPESTHDEANYLQRNRGRTIDYGYPKDFTTYIHFINRFEENSLDVLFVDGYVRSEIIKHGMNKVREGGLIFLHDVMPSRKSVNSIVFGFKGMKHLSTLNTMACFVRTNGRNS